MKRLIASVSKRVDGTALQLLRGVRRQRLPSAIVN